MAQPSPLFYVLLHCPASPAGMLYPMLEGCIYGLTGAAFWSRILVLGNPVHHPTFSLTYHLP